MVGQGKQPGKKFKISNKESNEKTEQGWAKNKQEAKKQMYGGWCCLKMVPPVLGANKLGRRVTKFIMKSLAGKFWIAGS